MAKRELWELQSMQSAPLFVKIRLTEQRIREWVDEYGEDGVYVSFSGGKDSTVLLHIVRNLYPNIPAVYVDTGLEYPEVKEFVKTFDNVEIIRPELSFKQVIEKYGYPFISKEVSQTIYEINHKKKRGEDYKSLAQYKRLMGEYVTKEGKKAFSREKYKFFMEDGAPEISHKCCTVMKKTPAIQYEKRTGRKPIIGTMAVESKLRTSKWLKDGCNGFHLPRPSSKPMSFWTEQDVLLYIVEKGLKIPSVYGEIVPENGEIDGQTNLSELGIFEKERPLLKTTGCERTGCMYCGYGCHLKQDPRFVRIKETHPKIYEWIMKPTEEGGLNYKAVIDWINEHGNLHIKY